MSGRDDLTVRHSFLKLITFLNVLVFPLFHGKGFLSVKAHYGFFLSVNIRCPAEFMLPSVSEDML